MTLASASTDQRANATHAERSAAKQHRHSHPAALSTAASLTPAIKVGGSSERFTCQPSLCHVQRVDGKLRDCACSTTCNKPFWNGDFIWVGANDAFHQVVAAAQTSVIVCKRAKLSASMGGMVGHTDTRVHARDSDRSRDRERQNVDTYVTNFIADSGITFRMLAPLPRQKPLTPESLYITLAALRTRPSNAMPSAEQRTSAEI